MNFKDALLGRISRIQSKAAADVLLIETKAASDIAELQAILDLNEGWLMRDTNAFYTKVSRVMDKIRE